jgi:hypothetical protein
MVVNTATLPLNDLLFISILLTGFFGLLRLGELTLSDDPLLINLSKTILREALRMTSTTCQFFLPANKTDPFFKGNRVVIRSTSDELDLRPLPPLRFPLCSTLLKFSTAQILILLERVISPDCIP